MVDCRDLARILGAMDGSLDVVDSDRILLLGLGAII